MMRRPDGMMSVRSSRPLPPAGRSTDAAASHVLELRAVIDVQLGNDRVGVLLDAKNDRPGDVLWIQPVEAQRPRFGFTSHRRVDAARCDGRDADLRVLQI